MRPADAREAGAVLCAAFALVVGCVYLVKAVRHLGGVATANDALSYSDREIAGGNSILVDQSAAYQARALIPRDSTYRVRVGPGLRNPTPLTVTYVESWFRYFLLPRRSAADARWIICYGCDTAELGSSYSTRWKDEDGISIGRIG
jgi:hypothetical protein